MENVLVGLLIPFLGTTLGSAMVFLMKDKINPKVQKLLLGFASGVMIAASIWSLITPSIEMAEEQGKISWIPASIGFLLGITFLLVLDSLIPQFTFKLKKARRNKSKVKKYYNDDISCNTSQYSRRYGSWCCVFRSISSKYNNNISWSICIINRNSNTKLSRRSNNINAIKK